MFLCKVKKGFYQEKSDLLLWIKGIRFYKKVSNLFLCKVKKRWFYQEKSDLFFMDKKKLFERGSTFIRWIYYACIT